MFDIFINGNKGIEACISRNSKQIPIFSSRPPHIADGLDIKSVWKISGYSPVHGFVKEQPHFLCLPSVSQWPVQATELPVRD